MNNWRDCPIAWHAYLVLQSRLPEADLVGDEPVAVLAVEVLDARKVLVHGSAVVAAVQEILSVAEIFQIKIPNCQNNLANGTMQCTCYGVSPRLPSFA